MADLDAQRLGGEKKLKLIDAVAQSVGLMGPVFSMAFLVPLIVGLTSPTGKGAGTAAPLAVLIAGVGVVGLGWIVAQYTRKIQAAGSLYDYVTDGLGGHLGAASGWLYYIGVLALGCAILVMTGGTIHDTVAAEFNWTGIPGWGWDLILYGLIGLIMYLGVSLSTRLMLSLALVSVSVVLAYSIYVIAKSAGIHHVSEAFRASSSPTGWSGVLFGVLYGVLLFTGFETSANLGEETEHPSHDIPRAVIYSVLVIGVFYVVVSFAQVAGYHFSLDEMSQNKFAPLFGLAGPGSGYGSVTARRIIELVVIFDMIAVFIGCSVSASRGFFALGRDRRMPRVLGSVSTRGTPANASSFVLVFYGLTILATTFWTSLWAVVGEPHYVAVFSFLSTFGGFALVVIYLLMSLGSFIGLRDHEARWSIWLAALIGIAVTGGAIYGAIYKVPSPTINAIYGALLIFAGGLVMAVILNAVAGPLTRFSELSSAEQEPQKL
jgi:amino acid transporter